MYRRYNRVKNSRVVQYNIWIPRRLRSCFGVRIVDTKKSEKGRIRSVRSSGRRVVVVDVSTVCARLIGVAVLRHYCYWKRKVPHACLHEIVSTARAAKGLRQTDAPETRDRTATRRRLVSDSGGLGGFGGPRCGFARSIFPARPRAINRAVTRGVVLYTYASVGQRWWRGNREVFFFRFYRNSSCSSAVNVRTRWRFVWNPVAVASLARQKGGVGGHVPKSWFSSARCRTFFFFVSKYYL